MPPWGRSVLAAFVGYFAFAAFWTAAVRPFDGRPTLHLGHVIGDVAGALLGGLLLGALGLLVGLGFIFLVPAILWARLQIWLLARAGLERPGPSVAVGMTVGLAVGYGFNLMETGHLVGVLASGVAVGGIAGYVLCPPDWRPPKRSVDKF